jgi:UDP-glucose 4-epimerase
MRVIIIGSKGFIGQHLTRYFTERGHEVWRGDVIVDYLDTERYFLIDASNADFSSVFGNSVFDLCVNCSGAASVADSLKNPARDYYLNTLNVFNILEAIRKFQPECRFINLSSAAIYGNPKQLPVKETFMPNPISPYGLHKLQAEQICKEYNDFYNIKTCSLRIFSVYGNGLQKQLFWDLYKRAKAGSHFTLFGTGNESRDFIHVLDLARAIELVSEFSEFSADIINVANGEEIKISDAVSSFYGFFETEIDYSFSGNTREGDPTNWVADISKLTSFGYQPSINIKTGLKNYYEWIEKEGIL